MHTLEREPCDASTFIALIALALACTSHPGTPSAGHPPTAMHVFQCTLTDTLAPSHQTIICHHHQQLLPLPSLLLPCCPRPAPVLP